MVSGIDGSAMVMVGFAVVLSEWLENSDVVILDAPNSLEGRWLF